MIYIFFFVVSGPRKKKEKGRKAKSSGDLSKDEGFSPTSSPPTVSRRKKLWNSLRKSTERIRGKSRERKEDIKVEAQNLSGSQPNICSASDLSGTSVSPEYDVLFAAAELRQKTAQLNGEHSRSDPTLTPRQTDLRHGSLLAQAHSDSQDIDVDSGIAVVENSAYPAQVRNFAFTFSPPGLKFISLTSRFINSDRNLC